MRARLFNLSAGASSLLFVATMGLWASSYWYRFSIGYEQRPDKKWVSRSYGMDIVSGAISTGFQSYRRPTPPPPDSSLSLGWLFGCYSRQELEMPHWTKGLWFNFAIYRTRTSTTPSLQVPCWAPAGLFLILPMIWVRRHRRSRRLGLNLGDPAKAPEGPLEQQSGSR